MHKVSVVTALLACSLPTWATVDSGLVSLLPSGVTAVFGVNAQEAKGTAFGQYVLNNSQWDSSGFQKMVAATNFDPRRDLQSFVVGITPASGTGQAPPAGTAVRQQRFAMLARGTFDAAQIGAAAVQHGSTVQNLSGAQVYVNNDHGQNNGFTFLDVDLAAVGDLDTLGRVISAHNGAKQVSSDLVQLINKAASENDIWFASLDGASGMAIPSGQGGPAQILQSVQQASGGLKLGSTVQFTFDALTRSPKDANSLADVIRMFASMAQVHSDQTQGPNPLAPALTNLNLVTNGSEVLMTTSLPETALEQMSKMHQQAARPKRTTPPAPAQ